MKQRLNQDSFQNVLLENPIDLKIKFEIKSFICSLNKNLLGIYYDCPNIFNCFRRYNGKIIIFLYKRKKWIEYYKIEIQSSNPIQLLCFTNNDTQLLFHREKTNWIESLCFDQVKIFKLFSYVQGTINIYIKFSPVPQLMILSNDQKLILIKAINNISLLDIIQKQIIFTTSDGKRHYENINYFNNSYLIQTEILNEFNFQYQQRQIGKRKVFYNIKNKKVQKSFYFSRDIPQNDYTNGNIDDIQQLNNFSNIGHFCICQGNNYVTIIFNVTNLKFIRKLNILSDCLSYSSPQYFGSSQRYLIYRFSRNQRVLLLITDLFSFEVEVVDLNQGHFKFANSNNKQINKNLILLVKDDDQQQAQFWLTK